MSLFQQKKRQPDFGLDMKALLGRPKRGYTLDWNPQRSSECSKLSAEHSYNSEQGCYTCQFPTVSGRRQGRPPPARGENSQPGGEATSRQTGHQRSSSQSNPRIVRQVYCWWARRIHKNVVSEWIAGGICGRVQRTLRLRVRRATTRIRKAHLKAVQILDPCRSCSNHYSLVVQLVQSWVYRDCSATVLICYADHCRKTIIGCYRTIPELDCILPIRRDGGALIAYPYEE